MYDATGHNRWHALFFMPALLLALLPRPANTQVLFGSIVGSVTDSSGAAVPGASVKVTQVETNDTRETKTNDAGGFTLSTIHAGTYKVEVTKEGFKGYAADNLQVSLNTVVRVDAMLQVGMQSQRIERADRRRKPATRKVALPVARLARSPAPRR